MNHNRKYYRKLKTRMFEMEIDQVDIAERAGRSLAYMCQRFQGKRDFDLNDIYTIMEMLEIPPERILEYFPRDGIGAKKEVKIP